MKHAFNMICDKMVRAGNGDYRHTDNLKDIIGYAKLALKELEKKTGK